MAKPRIPNQKKMNSALASRLNRYVARVQSIYDSLNAQAARIVEATPYDGEAPFSFSDYPEVKRLVEELKRDFVGQMSGVIYSGTSDEWKQSNIIQDLLAKKVLKHYDAELGGEKQRVYYQTNSDALKAFQRRTEYGMNLSSKVWNQSDNYVQELEYAISSAIEKGMSAVTLSKRISQYLNDFPSLKADYTERYGSAVDCADCEYRSIRLARSEINMAYRTAEQTRWKQFDFILGYEVKLSGSHPKPDICDDLAGKYPKDFKFTGWHPNCLCYCVPIIMSEDDYWRMREGEVIKTQPVTELPEKFKDYVRDRESQIVRAGKHGTQPYWIRDNKPLVDGALNPSTWKMSGEDAKQLRAAGITINPTTYNRSAMQGFQLPRFNDSMEQIGDKEGIYWQTKNVSVFKNGNTTMTYKGMTDVGPVEIARSFRKTENGIEAVHDRFFLPEDMQGQGIAKSIFREMFREYGDMRVSRVTLKANADVGGYAWGKYGFCATRAEVENLLSSVRSKSIITQAEYERALDVVNGLHSNTIPMNYLANMSFGEKMLKGQSWQGFLDFSNRAQVKYMKDYVGYPE